MGLDSVLGKEQDVELDFLPGTEDLIRQQASLTHKQLENIERQVGFQKGQLTRVLGEELPAEAASREAALAGATGLLDTTRQLIEDQAAAAAAGVAATPEQKALIAEQARQAIALGESDINRFLQSSGEILREELSPTLGLRPSDSPILDRGQRAREEAIRQQGQLVRGIRQAEAQQLLEFPIAASEAETAQRTAGARLSEATRQFQQQLAQAAFQNRLNLTGQVGSQGLQLASIGGTTPIVQSGSTTNVSDPLGQLGRFGGGVGGLLTGFGTAFPSG